MRDAIEAQNNERMIAVAGGLPQQVCLRAYILPFGPFGFCVACLIVLIVVC